MLKRIKEWFLARKLAARANLFRSGWDYVAGSMLAGDVSEVELDAQAHDPFDDNAFNEGMRAALRKTQSKPDETDYSSFWPIDSNMPRKDLVARIGQMNYKITSLRKENAGLIRRNRMQAEELSRRGARP